MCSSLIKPGWDGRRRSVGKFAFSIVLHYGMPWRMRRTQALSSCCDQICGFLNQNPILFIFGGKLAACG